MADVLIVILGLPGTGKSAVTEALVAELGAMHLSIDVVEDALIGAGLPRSWQTGVAAYESVRAAAEQPPSRISRSVAQSSSTPSTTAPRRA